jgi:hypothetical protein
MRVLKNNKHRFKPTGHYETSIIHTQQVFNSWSIIQHLPFQVKSKLIPVMLWNTKLIFLRRYLIMDWYSLCKPYESLHILLICIIIGVRFICYRILKISISCFKLSFEKCLGKFTWYASKHICILKTRLNFSSK